MSAVMRVSAGTDKSMIHRLLSRGPSVLGRRRQPDRHPQSRCFHPGSAADVRRVEDVLGGYPSACPKSGLCSRPNNYSGWRRCPEPSCACFTASWWPAQGRDPNRLGDDPGAVARLRGVRYGDAVLALRRHREPVRLRRQQFRLLDVEHLFHQSKRGYALGITWVWATSACRDAVAVLLVIGLDLFGGITCNLQTVAEGKGIPIWVRPVVISVAADSYRSAGPHDLRVRLFGLDRVLGESTCLS